MYRPTDVMHLEELTENQQEDLVRLFFFVLNAIMMYSVCELGFK